jgi:DNA mismatch repair protein MutS
MLKAICSGMDPDEPLVELLDRAIAEDPPFSVREGGMIRDGYNEELDSLREIVNGGAAFLEKIEREEQERTGIKKLKIGYNRVFGYYIEVLNTYKDLVPENYIRKQTLTNCERYITPELKELEARVLGAQDRIAKLEYSLFCEIREAAAARQLSIRQTGDQAAVLDALCSLARVAEENGYVRPTVDLSDEIEIREGRHPVVEKFMDGLPFVPNDTEMNGSDSRTLIITGPNMAGKSTYMRQTALIVLLAQIGSFVPAASATVGIVDSIFTRIGAADDLAAGQSTFMTEMSEVASILANATSKSLIVLDEIGRGTSTFDGMSIARAVLEYVNDPKKIGAKTMFATHYHELTEIENELAGVKNYNTSVKKRGEEITFLRRIVPGPADGSYGIEVAKLAGVPDAVIRAASAHLKELTAQGAAPSVPAAPADDGQVTLTDMGGTALIERLRGVDPDSLTPREALTLLYELKKEADAH